MLPVLLVPPRVVAPPVRPVVPRVTWVLPVLLGVLVERVIVPVVLTELERSLAERFT